MFGAKAATLSRKCSIRKTAGDSLVCHEDLPVQHGTLSATVLPPFNDKREGRRTEWRVLKGWGTAYRATQVQYRTKTWYVLVGRGVKLALERADFERGCCHEAFYVLHFMQIVRQAVIH